MDTDDEFAISYLGVTPGVPVLTRDGEEFGILEHVLEVPEEDIFEGIVVWVGGGSWADRFEQSAAPPLDPGLARAGIALFRELPATAGTRVLLCTDLHAGNVLAAAREPWLVIDPKPHVGDAAYDPLQHLLNCEERLHADPRGLARRMASLLDLDPDRVLSWLFARCVQESAEWPALAEVARTIAPG